MGDEGGGTDLTVKLSGFMRQRPHPAVLLEHTWHTSTNKSIYNAACMRHLRFIRTVALVVLASGCTTLYEARIRETSEQESESQSTIQHCLSSLGFEDRSLEGENAQAIRADSQLAGVWSPPRRSFWSDPPYAIASVRRTSDVWTVRFVPSNGKGDDARYFSHAFATCLTLHEGRFEVEISSKTGIGFRNQGTSHD